MKTYAILFLLSLTVTGGTFPKQIPVQSDECSTRVVAYKDRGKIKDPAFNLDLASPSGGHLLYLGARHSLDPSDPEFSEFEKAWNDFKPTIAFYEGGSVSRPVVTSRDDAIKTSGEPGLIRFLAARESIAAVSLEPNRQDEVNYLLKEFSAEQVKLFYVLRVIAESRDLQKRSEAELRAEVGKVLDRFSRYKGLESVLQDPAQLEAAYHRYWKSPQNWWEAPAAWFDPTTKETGGIFTNQVNMRSSGYRDLHIYEVLAKAALDGKRVFAIIGRDHVPMQAAALRCALK